LQARPNGHRGREAPIETGDRSGKTGPLDTPGEKDLTGAVVPAEAAPIVASEVTTDARRNVSDQRHRLCPKLPLPLFRTTKVWIPSPARFA
jgi:hypothetical protein